MALSSPRRKKSEIAFASGKIKVERHELEGEPEDAMPWFTLALADWVVVAAVTEGGQFVLVRQHRQGVNRLTVETAGGILEAGEDPAEAALRELREETGWEAETAESLGWVHPNAALQGNRCFLFLARGAKRVAGWSADPGEMTEPVVMSEDEVRRALAVGEISHALAVVALERALARIHEGGAIGRVMALLERMEEGQRDKVLDLARRLIPHLTAEDIRNPHDFPDLTDPDWHFEDGPLAGIQAVRFAVVRLRNESESGS
ncbi:MAG: NUDIX hydrolase [Polyangiaceae bacterium]